MIATKLMIADEEILKCFSIMKTLRLTLNNPSVFLDKIKRQQNQGYKLLALFNNDYIVAIAGYRYLENLIHGEFIYIDDLVTDPEYRGAKLGSFLFDEIVKEAKTKNLDKVVLDSGLNNSLAHRFYYRQGMLAKAMHFTLDLPVAA